MAQHDEYLELCAAATASELTAGEQAKLNAHLAVCAECRRAMREFEVVAHGAVPGLAPELALKEQETDSSWSVEEAEGAFFKRLDKEQEHRRVNQVRENQTDQAKHGQRFRYHPSQLHWREVWMSLAAAVLLAVALGIAAYRSGVKSGTDVARTVPLTPSGSVGPLEEQASDAGYERSQMVAKLEEEGRTIADLRRQLAVQIKEVNALRGRTSTVGHPLAGDQVQSQVAQDAGGVHDKTLETAQAKLQELQKTIESLAAEREQTTLRAAALEARVGELTQLVRDRGQDLDRKETQVARQQELLEHDRDIRELMGARDLYIAEVHDVSRTGQTDRTYGRVFYTKGKSLIFYAYDLDAQPGIRKASTFQAWGRRGPDKQQALNLGIFYEDNANKKRWVLKASDSKTLEDIDAVFVTVEPNGGSHHPSGKPLLFAYLRVSPNHP